jgi:hypothetical protein
MRRAATDGDTQHCMRCVCAVCAVCTVCAVCVLCVCAVCTVCAVCVLCVSCVYVRSPAVGSAESSLGNSKSNHQDAVLPVPMFHSSMPSLPRIDPNATTVRRKRIISFAMPFDARKLIILPRQARDKHRERHSKRDTFCAGPAGRWRTWRWRWARRRVYARLSTTDGSHPRHDRTGAKNALFDHFIC